jgi:hypothetical protein
MKNSISFFSIIISIIFSINVSAQSQETIVTVTAIGANHYEDIQYQGMEVNQIVDFSNLVRVYINKGSVVMVDNEPVAFDSTGVSIRKIFIADVESKFGNITIENIDKASCDLKLLVRKSAFTKRDDYHALMDMVNGAIWELQKYYSNNVYGKEYPELKQKQKDKINKLVPLKNLLAKDNTD